MMVVIILNMPRRVSNFVVNAMVISTNLWVAIL